MKISAVRVITCTGIIFVQVITCTKFEKDSVQVITCTISQLVHNIHINKGAVAGILPTTESNLRTALGVEICKLCIIARICKPLPEKLFSDVCSEIGICCDVM